jgi:hypothetical protein
MEMITIALFCILVCLMLIFKAVGEINDNLLKIIHRGFPPVIDDMPPFPSTWGKE